MMRRYLDQRGNVSLVAVICLVCLATLMALAVSVGCAYVRWVQLSHAVETARQSTMTAGFQMRLKNEASPGDVLAQKLISELRRAGVEGETLILFEESADSSLGDNVRAMALYARVETSFKPCAFMDSIDIPITTSLSIVPYAESRVYRPDKSTARTGTVRTYRYAAGSKQSGSGQMVTQASDLGLLQNALEETIEKAKTM